MNRVLCTRNAVLDDSAKARSIYGPLVLRIPDMGQEERIKGLETITKTLGERLEKVDVKLNALLSASKDAETPHWAVGVLTLIVLGWMGWISLAVIGQGNKLSTIGGILSPQDGLKSLTSGGVSTDPKKATKELAQATVSFQKLGRTKVTLPDPILSETSQQLITLSNTHQDLPETWSAIGAFITYRSQLIHGWQETNLPPCTGQFHKAQIIGQPSKTNNGDINVTHGPVEIHDCKIILDSPETTIELSPDLSLSDVVFTHCAVFYNGGPIVLVPVKIARDMPPQLIGRLTFTDCLFIVTLSGVPAAHGTDFARALLSSPDGNLTLVSPS
jgi:hypothetical protein